MKKELKAGLKQLKELMEEQIYIINKTGNKSNEAKLDGMIKTAYLLGYDTVIKNNNVTLIPN